MKRFLTISILLLAVILTVNADRRRLLMSRNSTSSTLPTPILRLEMNEGSGVTMADSSGNANTFTNLGATWITGKSGSGGALQFDGVDDFARSVANLSGTSGVKIWTFTCWLYWDAFSGNDDLLCELSINYGNNDGSFAVNPNSSSPSGFNYLMQDSSAGTLQRVEYATRPSAAAWHHYAAVFNGTANANQGDITVYVDGVSTSTTTFATTKDQASDLRSDILYLMSRAGTSLFGAGRLDDVGVWPRELTSAEVTEVMNQAR